MDLEIRHLKLVRAVSAFGGLTHAGRELHLTQSALSHQLRDAEARLGTALFFRVGKRMVLTTAGECLLRSAGEILDTLERTEDAIRELAGGRRGRLRLSMGGYTEYHWLPAVVKALRVTCPETELQIVAGVGWDPVDLLVEGRIDIGLIDHDVEEDSRVALRRIFDDEVVVIMDPRHALASRRWIEPADFSNQTLIADAPLERHAIHQRLLAPAGVTPARVQLVAQSSAIVELVKAGVGIATIARWAVEPVLAAGAIRALPLTRQRTFQSWSAAVLTDQAEVSCVRMFIDLVRRGLGSGTKTRLARLGTKGHGPSTRLGLVRHALRDGETRS
jgi:LysR family transcriptional regulator for metE and metH